MKFKKRIRHELSLVLNMHFFVDVYLPLSLPKPFTYSVTNEEFKILTSGYRVAVPFGRSKIYTGIVVRKHQVSPQSYEAKFIESILDKKPCIYSSQIEFWEWIADYYQCSVGSVIRASIPAILLLESETNIVKNKDVSIDKTILSDEEYLIYEALEKSVLKIENVVKISGKKNAIKLLQPLVEIGAIIIHQNIQEKYKPKTEKVFRINQKIIESKTVKSVFKSLNRSPKQMDFIMSLFSLGNNKNEWINAKTVFDKSNTSSSISTALLKKNIIEKKNIKIERLRYEGKVEKSLQKLSDEQNEAFLSLKKELNNKNVVLLQGVTSSGKTAVYMKYIKELIDKGGQVLFLLPEISITSQMVIRFQAYFGNLVQVYHSKFNLNERTEVWRNVYEGAENAKVIIGARSSLFLPFKKLDLIVVDEEHEISYKQFDPAPRYHARDASIYLSNISNSKVILGSATPSLETLINVKYKKYGVVYLNNRFGGVKFPEIKTIDLKDAYRKKRVKGDLSIDLIESISDTLELGKQVILFQNRRGYAPILECLTCRHMPQCVQCDVTLTHHKNSGKLQCHYCGYNVPIPIICHSCGSPNIVTKGTGTQQIEKQLHDLFPSVAVARMDWDSTRGKNDFDRIINSFSSQEIKILVGTQMVVKGLDFKNVQLVGVINADHLINFPDFRSYERSFQMLTQVSGRSGRSTQRGRVMIQTYQPQHPVIKNVIENDIKSFIESELKDRKLHSYPPFVRLIRITLKNRNIETLSIASDWFLNVLSQSFNGKILGPVYPPVARVKNYYHKQLLIKLESKASRLHFKNVLQKTKKSFESIATFKSTKFIIDVDPY